MDMRELRMKIDIDCEEITERKPTGRRPHLSNDKAPRIAAKSAQGLSRREIVQGL